MHFGCQDGLLATSIKLCNQFMVDHSFFFSFPFPKSAERFAKNIQLMYVAFSKSTEGFIGVMILWL